jgi:hypothetical protein
MLKFTEKPKTVLATPALVREFVEMEPAPYDRPLSERRLQVYERILRSGDFRPVVWASAVCAETGVTYRVNGKHTSLLLSRMTPIPEFHVTIERYACETLTEVANLYNTFDSNLTSRTTNDINAAFAASVGALRGVPHRTINLAVSAAAAHKWDEAELKKVPPAERAEELLDNIDFVQFLCRLIPGGASGSNQVTRPLCRVAVATAMLATFRKAPRAAEDFWTQVRDETAPDRDDPTRVLARFLVRSAIAGGKGGGSERKLVTNREMFVKCLHAWNAWRKGERTALNYHAKSPVPAVSR